MTTNKPLSPLFGSRGNLAVFLVIIAAGLALRLLYFNGIWGTDDAEYARLANAMAHGNFLDYVNTNFVENITGPSHIPYRTGLIFPLAVLFRLFGVSEPVLIIYPLLLSMLVIVLAYLCGRMMFGLRAGLVAAAFWAFMPNDILRGVSFLPDIAVSFYGSLGVFVIIYFIYAEVKKGTWLVAGGFASGLIFGLTWLSKETVIYLIPFVVILLFMMLKKDFKRGLAFAVPMAVASGGVLAAETIIYYSINGDFLSHFHGTENSFEQTKSYLFYEGSRFGWPVGGSRLKALVKRLFLSGPETIFLNRFYLYLPAFALVAWARSLYMKKSHSFNLAGLWFITLAFMYNFATCSTVSYTPLTLLNRYLHPIMFPASLLTAGLVVSLLGRRKDDPGERPRGETFFWGAVISVVLILLTLSTSFRLIRNRPQHKSFYQTKHAAKFITSADRVYTDPLTTKSLEFYLKYPERMNTVDYEGMPPEEVLPGSFVLIDRHRVAWLKINVDMWLTQVYGYNEPEFYDSPPETWSTVWRGDGVALYRVE